MHVTLSYSEKPTDATLAVISAGAAAVMLTPFKEAGAAELTHETAEGS